MLGRAVDTAAERLAGDRRYIRPPGALPEAAFLAACTRCGQCTDVCPVHAIHPLGAEHGLAAGTPALEVALTACVMCAEMPCAAACPTDALDVPDDLWRDVHIADIAIDAERCITYHGTACGVCARVCPVGETALRLDPDGHPVLGDACTGCGVCIRACVTSPSSISAAPVGRAA